MVEPKGFRKAWRVLVHLILESLGDTILGKICLQIGDEACIANGGGGVSEKFVHGYQVLGK